MKTLRSILPYFRPYRGYLVFGFLFVIAANLFAVYTPVYVRKGFDAIGDLLTGKSQADPASTLLQYALIILGAALLRGVFMFAMRQTLIVMSRNVEFDMKNKVFEKYTVMSTTQLRQSNTGDLMARISEDVSRVRMFTGPVLMYVVNLLTTFILVIAFMIQVNPTLTMWVMLPVPILSVSIYFVNNLINRRSDELQSQLSTLTVDAQETFSGIRLIKAYHREKDFLHRFAAASGEYRLKALALAFIDAVYFPVILLLVGISNLVAIYVGGQMVLDGQITVGNIAEFVIYINMLTFPMAMLGWVTSTSQRAFASMDRINDFLLLAPSPTGNQGVVSDAHDRIAFENVSFTYPETGIEAIKNVSFALNPGKSIGITGTTGSGKSTLAALLLRQFDPTSGWIRVGNSSLADLDLLAWRARVAYVPQDVFLFSDTLEHNLLFGVDDEISAGQLSEVLNQAALQQTIDEFPDGLQTVIGERGITLSGGQKQRVSIARALLRDTPVLILDDCLSAVDTETEAQVLEGIRKAKGGKSSLIISHRISAIQDCDEILVMEDGTVKERGRHAELMALEGTYHQLYVRQQQPEVYS